MHKQLRQPYSHNYASTNTQEERTVMKAKFANSPQSALIAGTVLPAQGPPVVNISSYRHGNLAAAQSYIVQAYHGQPGIAGQ
jgi:hypothetical protein